MEKVLKRAVAPNRLLQSREATSHIALVLQLQPDISWTSCMCRGKTSDSTSNLKSTAFYHYTEEWEWRIKITKLTNIPENEWKSNKTLTWDAQSVRCFHFWRMVTWWSHWKNQKDSALCLSYFITSALFTWCNAYIFTSLRVSSYTAALMTWPITWVPLTILTRTRI